MRKAEDHLLLVTQERSLYKSEVEESRRQVQAYFQEDGCFAPPPLHSSLPPTSSGIMVHYAFDFAQQVHYPSNPLQLVQLIFSLLGRLPFLEFVVRPYLDR